MIDLARHADFALGSIRVHPSSRELVGPGGPIMVEPKVMQVLVVLADAGGRVVSRDELIEQCWAGRVVGEDAINRVIGKLRRVAEATDGAFRIETVARAGHRLLCETPVPSDAARPANAPSPPRAFPVRWLLAAVAVGLLMLVLIQRREQVTPAAAAKPGPMPAAVTDLETRGLSSIFENTAEQTAEGVGYLRQATALAPRAAPVWGSLAMSYVLSLGWAPPAERAGLVARARDAARRGLALEPRESRSIAALVSLEPTFGHWSAKAAALAAARSRAFPDTGPLAYQQVQFLIATGRNRAALAAIRPIVAASPLVPWIQAAYIDLLAANGQIAEADRAAEAAGKIWPRERLIWFTRFDLALFHGQAGQARAMASDRAAWPKQASVAEMELAARSARLLAAPGDTRAGELLRGIVAAGAAGHAGAERAIRVAAAVGRADVAITLARRLYLGRLEAAPRLTMLPNIGLPADGDPPTAALFMPPAVTLAGDPAFMKLMKDIGILAYWRHSGAPDFCRAPELGAACRAAGVPQQVAG